MDLVYLFSLLIKKFTISRIFVCLTTLFSLLGCGSGLKPCPALHLQNPIIRCNQYIFQSDQGYVATTGVFKNAVTAQALPVQGGCDLLGNGEYFLSSDKSCYFSIRTDVISPPNKPQSCNGVLPDEVC